MTTTDARKRNAARARDASGESFNDFIAHVYRWAAPSWRPVTYSTRTHTIDPETGHFTPITQEPDMTAKDRHDELVALLNKISEESVTASNVLADVLDLLRERLPEPTGSGTCMTCGTELYAGDPLDCRKHEPAPADDLPGEPVEPGDLRAGDRVAFTWEGTGERITGSLVSVYRGETLRSDAPDSNGWAPDVVDRAREWRTGISDVRLIERAPREDEDPDEALAKVIYNAGDDRHVYSWQSVSGEYLDMARAAREHIEAEQEEVVATLREEVAIQTARAEQAEVWMSKWQQSCNDARDERDALRERLDAFRADVERGAHHWSTFASTDRHRERIARGAGEDLTAYLDRDDERGRDA